MRINFHFNLDFIPAGSDCIDSAMRVCLETGESVPSGDDQIHLLTVSSHYGELSFDDFVSVSQKEWLDEAIGNVMRGGHPGHGYYDDMERLVSDIRHGQVSHEQVLLLMRCLDFLQEKLEFYLDHHPVTMLERNKLRLGVRHIRKRIADEDREVSSAYPELAGDDSTASGIARIKRWLDDMESGYKIRILKSAWISCPQS